MNVRDVRAGYNFLENTELPPEINSQESVDPNSPNLAIGMEHTKKYGGHESIKAYYHPAYLKLMLEQAGFELPDTHITGPYLKDFEPDPDKEIRKFQFYAQKPRSA